MGAFAAGVVLLLLFAVAGSAVAQTTPSPTRWVNMGSFNRFDVTTTQLLRARGHQSVTMRDNNGGINMYNLGLRACAWTAVIPGTSGTSGPCIWLKNERTGAWTASITHGFTPTQAMIDNGGVVILISWSGAGNQVAEWVPFVTPKPVTLTLTPPLISENGGISTVTASLATALTTPTTITVAAAPVSPAVAGDFTLSTNTKLTIAANVKTSTGVVTVTGVNNSAMAADKQVTISGSVASSDPAVIAENATLTLYDDDTPGSASITSVGPGWLTSGNLSGATVEVTLAGGTVFGSGVGASSFRLNPTGWAPLNRPNITSASATSGGRTARLTLGAGTGFSGTRSFTVTVLAAAHVGSGNLTTGAVSVGPVSTTLALAPASISEDGGVATVTARISRAGTKPTTVTVATAAGTNTQAADFRHAGTVLTIAAGETTSSGAVTVTAVNDALDGPNRSVTVSGAVSGGMPPNPGNQTLTITDDEATPTVTFHTASLLIAENGGATTVTAVLSGPSVQPTTITTGVQHGTGGAVAADYSITGNSILTIAAGATTTTDAAVITAVDNDVDAPNKTFRFTGTVGNGHGVTAPQALTMTLTDDEALPTATLALDPATVTENGGVATVTAVLSGKSSEAVTLTVAAAAGANTAASNFNLSTNKALAIAAGATTSTGAVTVTAVDNALTDGRKQVTVSAEATGGNSVANPSDVTLTIRDDDYGLDLGSVMGQATEGGGQATFTVALLTQPSAAVTVAVSSRDASEGRVSPAVLTFAPAAWNTAQTVTVTGVDDALDDGDVTWQVRLASSSGDSNYNALADEDVDVTTRDNDTAPGVTLALDPSSVSENGGISTVTARLSRPSSAATTLTVTAVMGAFTVGAGADATIVIAAGDTTSTDTAEVTGVDNDTDAPNRTETVTATVANDRATEDSTIMAVTGAALTLVDDDAAPGVTLALNPASVSENGGAAAVSATLSRPSSEPSTVTVQAASGFYTVGADATIVIAAGSTTDASDTASIAAVDDNVHQGSAGRSVTVTATHANGQGAGAVTGAALTLTDDETLPTLALVLSPASISEEGGVATVTATLTGPSSAAATVTVAAAAGIGAVAADFTQTGTTLTFSAGATVSAGSVTIRANGNAVASGNKQVTVSATAGGGNGLANPANATLVLADDDTPQVTLVLSSASVTENGGVSSVTARLDRQSSVAVTVTVSAAAVAPAVAGDFSLSTNTALTFAANATTSTGEVTVTGVDNATDAPNKRVTVSGTASDSLGLANDPPGVTLTLADDDGAPDATLAVNPASVSENGGTSAVSATLSRPSSQPTTVTVTGVAGAYAPGSDATIVIAAGSTTNASDTATVVATDNSTDEPNRTTTVTATLANGQGAGSVTGASLTLTDDDGAPTTSLVLSSTSISENGGVATVTAALSHPSSEPTTVTVAATLQSGLTLNDYTTNGVASLTIAMGATVSSNRLVVTGRDNRVDAPDKALRLSGTSANGQGKVDPSAVTLTIADDDATATATLVLTPPAILENGQVSTVTAVLDRPTTEPTTLTVAAAAGANTGSGDFNLSTATALAIAAGATASTGAVTVTSVDNNAADGRKFVTVSATATGGRGVAAPSDVTLVIRDNEFGLELDPMSGVTVTEAGGRATFTVALRTEPAAAVTVAVSSLDASEGRVSPSSLVFTTGNWETAQRVTVTGVDDDVDDGPMGWRVRLDASSGGDGDYDALDDEHVDVTTTDDDAAPAVTLALAPSTIPEDGGVATVTAVLSRPSGAATTVTVTASPVAPAVAADFTPAGGTLVFAAGATGSAGRVTVTAVDNDVDAADKRLRVTGVAVNDRAAADGETVAVAAAVLTVEDDDEKGLAFAPAAVVEVAGGTGRWTARLTSMPLGTVTVAVSGSEGVGVSPPALTFTAEDWATAQAVTVSVAGTVGEDGYAAALAVTHRASGGDYDGVEGRLAVSVAGATRIAVAAGTATYGIGGRQVTVTVEAGVPAGIEVDLDEMAAGAEPLALTFSPDVAADVLAEAVGDGYGGLGGRTSRRVVDVRVVGAVPSSGLEICLPASAGLVDAAAGRELLLLHYDGSAWEAVAGSSWDEGRMRVCAGGVASFSPFAVGYADERPELGPVSGTGQCRLEGDKLRCEFTVDEAIEPVTLPRAVGGDEPIRYGLAPALPAGIERDGRVLSGTPAEELAARAYVWTATDVDGQVAELAFTIEVVPALAAARERLAAVNRSVLPELSRAMWGSALDAIGARLSAGDGGGGGGVMEQGLEAAAVFLRSKGEALEDGGSSWRELVGGESFALALGGDGDGGEGAGGSPVVMWGGGDWRDLSRQDGLLSWSGKLFSGHVGADVALGGGVTGGVALSRFESAIAYTDRSDADEGAIAGDHEQRLVAVHPYLGWSGDGGERLWAALGYGQGEVRMNDTGIADRWGWQESEGRLMAGAVGGALPVYGDGQSSVEMRASAEATRYALADNGEAIAGVSVSTRRLRLATVGSWLWALRGGRTVEPSLEAGLRWDGGDGATGMGVELGAGLAWSDAAAGLSAAVSGRSLVAHGSDVEEWGASGSLHMDAGGDGRGLSLALAPAWGAAGSGLARLWDEGMAAREDGEGASLEGELGYGLAAWGEAGTVTPYGGLSVGGDERRYSLGQRLVLSEALGLGIEASRHRGGDGRGHSLALELRMGW